MKLFLLFIFLLPSFSALGDGPFRVNIVDHTTYERYTLNSHSIYTFKVRIKQVVTVDDCNTPSLQVDFQQWRPTNKGQQRAPEVYMVSSKLRASEINCPPLSTPKKIELTSKWYHFEHWRTHIFLSPHLELEVHPLQKYK